MRISPRRHTVAVLRLFLGLTQKEFADMVDVSAKTIQAIELEKLRLSETLANKISLKSGVAVRWLLDGNTSAPIIAESGKPLTRESAEKTRAYTEAGLPDETMFSAFNVMWRHWYYSKAVLLDCALTSLRERSFYLYHYRIQKFLRELTAEFKPSSVEIKSLFDGWKDPCHLDKKKSRESFDAELTRAVSVFFDSTIRPRWKKARSESPSKSARSKIKRQK
jgi:DNA-binding XRE family transcriptional regulator